MEFELYFFDNKTYDEILFEIFNDYSKYFNLKIDTLQYYICCDYFSITLDIDDLSDIKWISNKFELQVNKCIDIHIYNNKNSVTNIYYTYCFINMFINKKSGTYLLLQDVGDVFLKRINDDILINNSFYGYEFSVIY